MDKTSFRIRILTKNSIVGSRAWVEFFAAHRERFVVGLSIGTIDNDWAKRIEVGTSIPTARLWALGQLQAAGVPTYGMLCPVFPDVLIKGELDELVDRINPTACETIWAEPYNDRVNWRTVRDGYPKNSATRKWFDETYGEKNAARWSSYATELYERLKSRARRDGWLSKLKYLLYEDLIVERDAGAYAGFEGVLLQSKPGDDGLSQNEFIRAVQLGKSAA